MREQMRPQRVDPHVFVDALLGHPSDAQREEIGFKSDDPLAALEEFERDRSIEHYVVGNALLAYDPERDVALAVLTDHRAVGYGVRVIDATVSEGPWEEAYRTACASPEPEETGIPFI